MKDGEIVRNKAGKTVVKLDVGDSSIREATIDLGPDGKTVANVTLREFNPNVANALGGLLHQLVQWQWWIEETKHKEDKGDA